MKKEKKIFITMEVRADGQAMPHLVISNMTALEILGAAVALIKSAAEKDRRLPAEYARAIMKSLEKEVQEKTT